MRRNIQSLREDLPKMGFTHGRLELWAVHASAAYLFAGSETIVDGHVVRTPGLEVKFSKHQWDTRDPKVALVMIEESQNFEMPWGFYVIEECIPETLRDLFTAINADGRYVICYRLAENKPVEEIVNELRSLGLLDGEGVPAPPVHVDPLPKPLMLSCPACAFTVDGNKIQNAAAAMRNHVRAEHPEYKEENLAPVEASA